ncbi:MAG: HEAT repeat domain-containing protein [Cyanobacterium sp. T60_A2020_053]|nr:HEAT repeat domain-containing protein [Cyanobacterium sp. T60_A2020_053]
MVISKELISSLKIENSNEIGNLISKQNDVSTINFILENLGKLPSNFDGKFLFNLLNHSHKQVRVNAIKAIGKLVYKYNLDSLKQLFKEEKETIVKREIISTIGRQRDFKNVDFLLSVLEDEDPKIVCQAIRSLMIFDDIKKVSQELKKLINHPNEMVRTAIYIKYFSTEENNKSKLPHTKTYEFLKNVVVNGDVLKILEYVPDDSIHLTFTSPPYYNARDYSIYPSYESYLEFLNQVFQQIHRTTKEGRFLIVNTSPIIIPRISRAHSSKRYGIPFDLHYFLVKNGWEFIDDIIWLKPETSVKNRIGGFMQHKKPLGYKPNPVTEYLMVYRKETTKLLDWNIRQYSEEIVTESKVTGDYETSNVWKIDPCFDKVHSAVFPQELCRKVIQYYSYKGDLVFDPFGGSGTVGKVAKALDRLFFLTEQNVEYFNYIQSQESTPSLFQKRKTKFLTFTEFQNISF